MPLAMPDTVDLIESRLDQWANHVRQNYGWLGRHTTPLDIVSIPINMVFLGVIIVLAIYLMGPLFQVPQEAVESAIRPYRETARLLIAYAVAGFIGISVIRVIWGAQIQKAWEGVFPAIEFRLGDNIAVMDERRKLRRAMWAFPIDSLLIPIVINWIS